VAVAGGGFGGAVAEVPVAGAPLLPTLLVSHGAGGGLCLSAWIGVRVWVWVWAVVLGHTRGLLIL
jgi:hypothetical protein